jgi:xanthine dehydrogenase YagR molybdenum-binding subunit
MERLVTVRLGFANDVQDVTVVLPEGEPIPWQWGERFSVLGKETPRVDGPLKATGAARYTYDVQLPGMLYGAILRSPYPHAMVRSVDLSKARQDTGVVAALRVEHDEMRFAGQEVAAVAATSLETAVEALNHIHVEYAALPFVVDMDRAMAADAPQVFNGRPNAGKPLVKNVGDVARGFAQAAAVHEALYSTPVQTHVSLETHGAVASWNGDELTVWCSTQGIFTVREDLAVLFNLPPENVRVITEYLGGGFGSKFGAGAEVVIAARLARTAGAPVKLMLPRAAEHVATGNRPSSAQRVRLGASADGRLTAIELTAHGSGGVGGGTGTAEPYAGLYSCPNLRLEERDVYINAGPSSPMRAPGWVQGLFALELAMDGTSSRTSSSSIAWNSADVTTPIQCGPPSSISARDASDGPSGAPR